MIRVDGSATVSQVYGNTNREVMGSPAELRAREWASCPDRDAMLRHSGAAEFKHEIANATCIHGSTIDLFRGQTIKCIANKPPSVERMGPLLSPATEGRYHRAGQRALYTGSSDDGCRRELGAWYDKDQGGAPWIIKIRLRLNAIRIADFTDWPIDHFVTAAFCQAELCKVEGRNGREDYIFSQVIRDLVEEQFDGIKVPGVRGRPGAHYSNVVLFKYLDEWPSWVGTERAYLLPAWAAIILAHEHIAVAAYYIWEKDNRVHGRDRLHWCLGEDELRTHVLGV